MVSPRGRSGPERRCPSAPPASTSQTSRWTNSGENQHEHKRPSGRGPRHITAAPAPGPGAAGADRPSRGPHCWASRAPAPARPWRWRCGQPTSCSAGWPNRNSWCCAPTPGPRRGNCSSVSSPWPPPPVARETSPGCASAPSTACAAACCAPTTAAAVPGRTSRC